MAGCRGILVGLPVRRAGHPVLSPQHGRAADVVWWARVWKALLERCRASGDASVAFRRFPAGSFLGVAVYLSSDSLQQILFGRLE